MYDGIQVEALADGPPYQPLDGMHSTAENQRRARERNAPKTDA